MSRPAVAASDCAASSGVSRSRRQAGGRRRTPWTKAGLMYQAPHDTSATIALAINMDTSSPDIERRILSGPPDGRSA